jgi:hypothetical protein
MVRLYVVWLTVCLCVSSLARVVLVRWLLDISKLLVYDVKRITLACSPSKGDEGAHICAIFKVTLIVCL